MDGVTAIVRKLREKLPNTKVVLVAIFPRSENFSAQRGKVLQVNQVLRKLADGKDVFWADFGHRFVNPDGLIPADLMPDYLHLSQRGYEIWAEAIERRLSAIIGDAPVTPGSPSFANLTGEWAVSLKGTDQTFESKLLLDAKNGRLTGKFSRGENGWLEIQDAKVQGNEFSWTVKRDRSNGGVAIYHMTGKLTDGKITGTAKTTLDGEERSMDWTAQKR